MAKSKRINVIFLIIAICILFSCGNKNDKKVVETKKYVEPDNVGNSPIDINFSITDVGYEERTNIVEDKNVLKRLGKEHSTKYYTYMPQIDKSKNFRYLDVYGNEHDMDIDEAVNKNDYVWNQGSVRLKYAPDNCDMSYGIDVSKHNGSIDWVKVKNAGFDFAIVRIAYRGYGKNGTLYTDERGIENLKNAKAAGLKVGAYVFSQSINAEEAIAEAKLAVELIGDIELDLPLFYDPENIRNAVSRVENLSKEQWNKNATAFLDYVKACGFTPGLYSTMVWEHNYYDSDHLNNYVVWYADYMEYPQTPYNFEYWQFSSKGKVDGINGDVDLNVRITKKSN